MSKILLLGGTTEAREIAEVLARCPQSETIVSLAGATTAPARYPLPTRIGGFGGVEGLRRYLIENNIDLLVNATHPYADQMWRNAMEATKLAGVPMIVFHRPEWKPVEGDRWTHVRNVDSAVARLGRTRARNVFLPLGRKEIFKFEAAPKHNYLIRSIDALDRPIDLPNVNYLRERPPFAKATEIALMKHHRINLVVAKNSGGSASYAKIAAARELGIETILIRRPYDVPFPHCRSVAETLAAIIAHAHHTEKRVA